ncbi:endonuclease/exonuclease/phosphatase family protein [Candidatus Gracilibacteria bacterium]|nr:endonuclease/exonuclease/phosphatase family protein [Candidatus Gracilibacteria bacterium]
MKIISWNVNGLRAVEKKSEIQNLINTYDPDLVFMQEIKGTPDKFSSYLNSPEPYIAYYNPAEKAGYAGTGLWIHNRICETHDIEFMTSFPGDPVANEGRVAHLSLTEKSSGKVMDIFGIYFPNGGKSEEAWQGKLVFYREFSAYMHSLRVLGHSVLWGGDINCAHHAIDLARPEANDGKIGFHPLERAWLDSCVLEKWHDIWREKNPNQSEVYSWWDPVTRSRDRNVGWRIDGLWGDNSIIAKNRNIEYLQNQMGSDHCPIMIELDN